MDRIDYNIQNVSERVNKGVEQLEKVREQSLIEGAAGVTRVAGTVPGQAGRSETEALLVLLLPVFTWFSHCFGGASRTETRLAM